VSSFRPESTSLLHIMDKNKITILMMEAGEELYLHLSGRSQRPYPSSVRYWAELKSSAFRGIYS
jgi:hypothetical protein